MDEFTIKGGDGNEYGPVSDKVIRQWLSQGRANGQTQARKGAGGFLPLSQQPDFADLFGGSSATPTPAPAATPTSASTSGLKLTTPTPAAQPSSTSHAANPPGYRSSAAAMGGAGNNDAIVMALMEPITTAGFWLKLMAIVQILTGAMYAISIVGIIIAWLPIWIGVLLWQTANRAKDAAMTGHMQAAIEAQNKIKTLSVIMGILTLLSIIFMILYFAFIIYMVIAHPEFIKQYDQGY